MIHRWLERHADHSPWAPAIRFEGSQTTYAGLARQAAAMADALAGLGIRRGDRVAYLGQNHPAQLALVFACARLGAMLLPLNWRLAPPELATILDDAGAALLLALPEWQARAAAVAPAGCPVLDLLALPPGPPAPAIGTAQDALLLVYTSGTTGRPKGAVLDQRAVQGNALNSLHMHQLTAADRVLTALPMFHVGGLNIQTLPALYAGAEVLLLAAFDAEAWLVAVATGQATLSLMVPATMRAVLRHPDWAATDLSSLRAIGAGSSEVPVALIEPFHARGVPVQQVYGATETGPIALYQSAAEAIAAPGSLGRPALHAEVRVVDEAGAPCPPGVPGEIEVRGDATLRRYWGMAEPVLRDGWFATGDLGQVDAGGRWWFAGRRSDVIISGGENIWPAELERVLETAPGVLECAVCGRADPVWGEVPVAVLVVEPGFAEAAALAHTAVRLARFKQPRALLPVPALPRTALGKVDRAALRAMVG